MTDANVRVYAIETVTFGIPWQHLYIRTSVEDYNYSTWGATTFGSVIFNGAPQNYGQQSIIDLWGGVTSSGLLEGGDFPDNAIVGALISELSKPPALQNQIYIDVLNGFTSTLNNNSPYVELWSGDTSGMVVHENAMDSRQSEIVDIYPYNFAYQNSNTYVRELVKAAGLDEDAPKSLGWIPAYDNELTSNPGLAIDNVSGFVSAAWQYALTTTGIDSVFDMLTGGINTTKDWVTSIGENHDGDPTQVADLFGDMLDIVLDFEKAKDVVANVGSIDADTLFASAAEDWILGGGGDDIFHSAAGNDTFIGGEGIDLASFLTSDSGMTIDLQNEYSAVGGVFKDSIFEIENVTGTNYADVIRGTAESNTITGGQGNDNLSSRGGKDTFIHAIGDGSDILNGFTNDLSDVIMQFDDPDDVYLNVYSQDLFVTNGATGEQLTLKGQYYDTVSGFEFATLNGEDITGGLTIRGTSPTAAEFVHGTTFADTIDGGLGNDTLYGHGGADVFVHEVGDGNDQLVEVEGAQAAVLMNGVSSNDLYFNVYAEDLIVTDVATGEQLYLNDQYANVDGVKEFASVNGINVNYGLLIRGSSDTLGEVIHGTKYADTIIGGLGDDAIYGMGGNDIFIHNSGDGSDNIFAQSLNELATVTLSVSENDIEFNVVGGDLRVTDTTSGNVLYLKNQYIAQASGYEFNYVNNIDVTGALEISGTGGLYGTSFNDTIEGNYTAQAIRGNDGDDIFISSGGADYLYGQGGSDTFIFDSLTDSTISNPDRIQDFVRGVDVIDLSQIASIDEYSDITVTAYGGSTYIDDIGSSFRIWTIGTTGLDATDFIFT